MQYKAKGCRGLSTTWSTIDGNDLLVLAFWYLSKYSRNARNYSNGKRYAHRLRDLGHRQGNEEGANCAFKDPLQVSLTVSNVSKHRTFRVFSNEIWKMRVARCFLDDV